jgi:hypothetical protein
MKENIIDSSVWIEYFKGNRIYSNAIYTNDIILTELLPPIIHKKENNLADLLNSLRKNILDLFNNPVGY